MPFIINNFSVSLPEVKACNLAFSKKVNNPKDLVAIARKLGMPHLALLYQDLSNNKLSQNWQKRTEGLLKDLLLVLHVEPAEITKILSAKDSKERFALLKRSSISSNTNLQFIASVFSLIYDMHDHGTHIKIKRDLEIIATNLCETVRGNFFYPISNVSRSVHSPVLIKIANQLNSSDALYAERFQFVAELLDTIQMMYQCDCQRLDDIDFHELTRIKKTNNPVELMEFLNKLIDSKALVPMKIYAEIAKSLLTAETIENIPSAKDVIQEKFKALRKYYAGVFEKDIPRNGFRIFDKEYPNGKVVTIAVNGSKFRVTERDFEGNKPEKITEFKFIIPNGEENLATLATVQYLKSTYGFANELIAYMITTLGQNGYVSASLPFGEHLLFNQVKGVNDKCFMTSELIRPALLLDDNNHLKEISTGLSFTCVDMTSSERITLGTATIKQTMPYLSYTGNDKLETYMPGLFAPDNIEVNYVAANERGFLKVPGNYIGNYEVVEKVSDNTVLSYLKENPFKSVSFFFGGVLLVALGMAAWPLAGALLAGASFAGAITALVSFATAMSVPSIIGAGLGIIGGGILMTSIAALAKVFSQAPDFEVLVMPEEEPVKLITQAASDQFTLKELAKADKEQQLKEELEQLILIIQWIQESIDPKGKAKAKDLTQLNKETLRKALSDQLVVLDPTVCAQKIDEVFKRLITQVKEHQNAPIALAKFIEHLEALNLDILQALILKMKEEAGTITPRRIPETPPRAPSPPREDGGAETPPHTSVAEEKKGDGHKNEEDWKRLRHSQEHAAGAPQASDRSEQTVHV